MSKLVYLCLGIILLAAQFGCGGGAANTANANSANANSANPNNPVNPNPNDPNAPPPNENGPAGDPLVNSGPKGKPPLSTTNTITQPPAESSGISFSAMDFHSALMNGNKDQMAVLLADEFKGTMLDGSVQTKSQVLAAAKPATQMFSANVNPPQVKGDTATVTGTITMMSDDPKTAKSGQVLKFTDVWRKHGAKWLVASTTITK